MPKKIDMDEVHALFLRVETLVECFKETKNKISQLEEEYSMLWDVVEDHKDLIRMLRSRDE